MNEYYEYFGPTYQLDVLPSNMEDLNTPEYLEKMKAQVFENLRHTGFAPSVQMSEIPKMDHDDMEVDEDLDDANIRKPRELSRSGRTSQNRHTDAVGCPPQNVCSTPCVSTMPNSKSRMTRTMCRDRERGWLTRSGRGWMRRRVHRSRPVRQRQPLALLRTTKRSSKRQNRIL